MELSTIADPGRPEKPHWHSVTASYDPLNDYKVQHLGTTTYKTIRNWCGANCQHAWQHHSFNMWQFESAEDAVLFRLTWA